MRKLNHTKKMALVGAILVAAAWFAMPARWTTQAAVTPQSRVVQARVPQAPVVETMPIVPAEITEARRGKDWMDTANKTDW
jgi:hypothetical protein